MSHVRQNVPQAGGGGGRDAAAAPEERQKAMQMEKLQVNKQCQFILKPRPVEPQQPDVSAGEVRCSVWSSVLADRLYSLHFFSFVPEALQAEALAHHLGLLARLWISPERAVSRPSWLLVRPASELRLCG